MAVAELQLGHSDLVITGGVDTLNDIFMFMCFSKTPALSPTGDCRPFSDRADGTMLGEGLGMVALKRLADAERDGDRIYAVIRGVGSSSDGRSKSVYAPVPEGQAQALGRAYELAGYGPETVELVEAHGTGTKAGDVAEFEGLRQVFDGAGREDRQWCALGSVKSQIGHTKAAAGAAGLFKAVMALHHGVLPPTIKVDAPNPKLGLDESPFYLNTTARPWVRGAEAPAPRLGERLRLRRLATSTSPSRSTGARRRARSGSGPSRGRWSSSAATTRRRSWRRRGSSLLQAAGVAAADRLARLAHDSQEAYRPDAAARLAVLAADEAEPRGEAPRGREADRGRARRAPSRCRTAPPTGSGRRGQGRLPLPGAGEPVRRDGRGPRDGLRPALGVWDRAADLELEAGTSLQEVVFPRPGFGEEKEKRDLARLTATQWAQPAIAASPSRSSPSSTRSGSAPTWPEGTASARSSPCARRACSPATRTSWGSRGAAAS